MKLCFTVVGQAQWGGGTNLLPTVRTHGDCLTGTSGRLHNDLLSHSHYPDSEPTNPCPILIMPNTGLGSDKYQFKSHWFNLTRVRKCKVQIRTHDLRIPPISQNGRWMLYLFSHRTGLAGESQPLPLSAHPSQTVTSHSFLNGLPIPELSFR